MVLVPRHKATTEFPRMTTSRNRTLGHGGAKHHTAFSIRSAAADIDGTVACGGALL